MVWAARPNPKPLGVIQRQEASYLGLNQGGRKERLFSPALVKPLYGTEKGELRDWTNCRLDESRNKLNGNKLFLP